MHEIREALVEIERELLVRSKVYPKLVEQGKLSQGEADRRMRALRYAIYLLERGAGLHDKSTPLNTSN